MPDSVDVSPAIAQEMVDKGLFEPYTLTVDSEIPDGLKDADHNWTAAYYGIMAITTNTTIVRTAPQDVRRPGRSPSTRAWSTSTATRASRARRSRPSWRPRFANGGSADDIMPGIQFFAELKESGNLGGTDVTKETVLSRRDADRDRLELQRPGPAAPTRGRRPDGRDQLPERRHLRWLLRPGRRQGLAAPGLLEAVDGAHLLRRGRARLPRRRRRPGPHRGARPSAAW